MDINPALPQLLYMDNSLIVVSKPYNLSSAAGLTEDEQDCLISRLQDDFPTVQLVQVMDFACSGVMVLALTDASQQALAAQFAQQQIAHHYQARVSGMVEQDNGVIGQPPQTRWQVLERDATSSRLALTPLCQHYQLREGLRTLGHPVLGEESTADSHTNAPIERLQLHAQHLSFKHPNTGITLSFESPCPF